MNILDYLNGKKTYIVAFLIAVVAFIHSMGWITLELANTLYGLLGAAGLATTRASIQKNLDAVNKM